MPKVGDLVIFGEADAPQAHCIGRITRRDGSTWHGVYLSERTCKRYQGALCDAMVTPVQDFGVSVEIDGSLLTAERVGPSRARYSDQTKRDWQEDLPVTIVVR